MLPAASVAASRGSAVLPFSTGTGMVHLSVPVVE